MSNQPSVAHHTARRYLLARHGCHGRAELHATCSSAILADLSPDSTSAMSERLVCGHRRRNPPVHGWWRQVDTRDSQALSRAATTADGSAQLAQLP